MGKIKKLSEVVKIARQAKKQSQTVGLITGCFDILHIDHIRLFQFAKKHCDVVIVGLDNDPTIRLSKGEGRPIHTQKIRSQVLAELESVDYVFLMERVINFGTEEANVFHSRLVDIIKPTYLITNPRADRFWKEKYRRARRIGAILLQDSRKTTSSTKILEHLLNEL